MDPFSIAAGVAGLATAGSALSRALYDIIGGVRDAPREMFDIASGLRELSSIMRELKKVLKTSSKMCRDSLLRHIMGSMRRIQAIHDEVRDIIDNRSGGIARITWAFRKSRATKLLARVEAHKSTLQLWIGIVVLAAKQRQDRDHQSNTHRASVREQQRELREDTENILRDIDQRVKCLSKPEEFVDAATQTEGIDSQSKEEPEYGQKTGYRALEDATTHPSTDQNKPDPSLSLSDDERDSAGSRYQIYKWQDTPDDEATWLYDLVFNTGLGVSPRASGSTVIGDSSKIPSVSNSSIAIRFLDISSPRAIQLTVDRLLRKWTTLSVVDVEATASNCLRNSDHDSGRNIPLEFIESQSIKVPQPISDTDYSDWSDDGDESSSEPERAASHGGSSADTVLNEPWPPPFGDPSLGPDFWEWPWSQQSAPIRNSQDSPHSQDRDIPEDIPQPQSQPDWKTKAVNQSRSRFISREFEVDCRRPPTPPMQVSPVRGAKPKVKCYKLIEGSSRTMRVPVPNNRPPGIIQPPPPPFPPTFGPSPTRQVSTPNDIHAPSPLAPVIQLEPQRPVHDPNKLPPGVIRLEPQRPVHDPTQPPPAAKGKKKKHRSRRHQASVEAAEDQ